MNESVSIPAWAYCYAKRPHPSRGILFWCLLRHRFGDEAQPPIRQATAYLTAATGLTRYNVRKQLRLGVGTFWSNRLRLRSWEELAAAVAAESCASLTQPLLVPLEIFRRSLQEQRAWLSQPALTRGAKPCSLDYSARELGRQRRSVTVYRRLLRLAGRLRTIPHYQKVRERHGGNIETCTLWPANAREFARKDGIYRRLPDIVLLMNASGELIDILANPERTRRPDLKRRYFTNSEEYEEWKGRGRPASSDPVLVKGGNLLRSEGGSKKIENVLSVRILSSRGKDLAAEGFTPPPRRSSIGGRKGCL
jgi:hypothetical protein